VKIVEVEPADVFAGRLTEESRRRRRRRIIEGLRIRVS
jgi:hypothetical protein